MYNQYSANIALKQIFRVMALKRHGIFLDEIGLGDTLVTVVAIADGRAHLGAILVGLVATLVALVGFLAVGVGVLQFGNVALANIAFTDNCLEPRNSTFQRESFNTTDVAKVLTIWNLPQRFHPIRLLPVVLGIIGLLQFMFLFLLHCFVCVILLIIIHNST